MPYFGTYVFVDLGTTDIMQKPIDIINVSMIAVAGETLYGIEEDNVTAESLIDDESYWTRGEFSLKDIVCFLENLNGPICLVAHNGLRFDFPLLKKLFMRKEDIFSDIMCVDSLHFFYDAMEPKEEKSSRDDRKQGSFPWQYHSRRDTYDLERLFKRVVGRDTPLMTARDRNRAVVELVGEFGMEFTDWAKKNHYPCLDVPSEVLLN